MRPIKSLVLAFLLLPALAFAQPKPAQAPVKAKIVKVVKGPVVLAPVKAPVKAPVAKVVVTPETQMAHVVVPPASQPVVAPASAPAVVPVSVSVQVAPASQPAAVKAAWKVWLADNWLWVVFVVLIPSLINGLSKKGVRKGIIGFLQEALDRVSVTTNKNTVGTFKAPVARSGPPVEPPKK